MESIVLIRGIERLLIQLGAIVLIVFGLFLYRWGTSGKASLFVEAKGARFQLLNGAPGLFFALFGLAILLFGIRSQLDFESRWIETMGQSETKISYGVERESEVCEFLRDIRSQQIDQMDGAAHAALLKHLAERAALLAKTCD